MDIRGIVRGWLDIPSRSEMVNFNREQTRLLTRLSEADHRLTARENSLYTRISERERQLRKQEDELHNVAAQTTVAIYDAAEQLLALRMFIRDGMAAPLEQEIRKEAINGKPGQRSARPNTTGPDHTGSSDDAQ